MTSSILKVLSGQRVTPFPVWFMRQAGRHLPEYLEVRAKSKNFVDFCLSPDLAIEATLQPVRRYNMDAAILFADILLIPLGLGRNVSFVKGTGPVLDPITPAEIMALPDMDMSAVANVFETVKGVSSALPDTKSLIGFAGGPWTVATYMIEGQGSRAREEARKFAYMYPKQVAHLLNRLADATVDYLYEQIKAGAKAVKLFESWAEGLSPQQFESLVVGPTIRIVRGLRDKGVDVPIIGFPRGAGEKSIHFANATGINALACGTDSDLSWTRDQIGPDIALQGNLDPLLLITGRTALDAAVKDILAHAKGPHIFNLGHGVTPQTPIENVHRVVELIRGYDYGHGSI